MTLITEPAGWVEPLTDGDFLTDGYLTDAEIARYDDWWLRELDRAPTWVLIEQREWAQRKLAEVGTRPEHALLIEGDADTQRRIHRYRLRWFSEEIARRQRLPGVTFAPAHYDSAFKDDLKSRISLPDYVAAHYQVVLQHRAWGKATQVWALCPFHDDHHPSMLIHERFAHCFSCEWQGDLYDFIEAFEGLRSFPEQLEAAAASVGLPLPSSPARPGPLWELNGGMAL